MIVVDSNIIFSALISKSDIYNILKKEKNLIMPKFAIIEIFKYKEKIAKHSKLSENEILEVLYDILKNIKIVDEDLISAKSLKKAYDLTKEIDEKDTLFVALAIEFNASLWSGDKKLIKELKEKVFNNLLKE